MNVLKKKKEIFLNNRHPIKFIRMFMNGSGRHFSILFKYNMQFKYINVFFHLCVSILSLLYAIINNLHDTFIKRLFLVQRCMKYIAFMHRRREHT